MIMCIHVAIILIYHYHDMENYINVSIILDNSSSMCACMMYVQLQTFNRDSTVNAWTSLVV